VGAALIYLLVLLWFFSVPDYDSVFYRSFEVKPWDNLEARANELSVLVWAFLGLVMLGGNEIFLAVSFPFRWCQRFLVSLASVFPAMVTYFVRDRTWSVVVKTAMGLDGYRFNVPMVKQAPSHIAIKFGRYEDMPIGAERRALKSRSAWIERHIEDVSHTFSKMTIATTDISSLLRTIEADQTLVHAAYYTDNECIARIADWIAAKDDPLAPSS